MNIDNKILIMYHREDNDGVFSAAIFRNYLVYDLLCEKEDVICAGIDYGDVEKIDKSYIDELHEVYSTLILTDISFKADVMNYANKVFGNDFIWIDHHKPIINECEKYKASSQWKGERGTDRSAIMLAWKYCYDPFDVNWNDNRNNIPALLIVLSAWDSFTYESQNLTLDYVRKVNEGINQLFDLNLVEVYKFLESAMYLYPKEKEFESLIEKAYVTGTLIVNFQQRVNDNLVKNYGDRAWTIGNDNRKACMLICQGQSSSLMFNELKDTNIKSGIVFKYRPINNDWVISLYNIDSKDESFHCGEYMKVNYKGGGHLGAAGGSVTQKQFEKLMKNKHL